MKEQNAEKYLADCNPRDNKNPDNIDPVPEQCTDDGWPSQKRVARRSGQDWTRRKTFNKLGLGQHGLCDPIQTGQIINDLDTPDRDVIYRYSRGIRAADEAMLDMFRNTFVIDEEGKAHVTPIIWASQEKAVAYILQDNTRKDNSLVVDRIRLPIMAIWNAGMAFDQARFTYQKAYSFADASKWADPTPGFWGHEKACPKIDTLYGVTRGIPVNINYTLYIWTLYEEDMNQILEQVITKFSPVAYIQVKGVWWEVIVTLDSLSNNIDIEPGDAKIRVLKYQIGMTAKTYIPQPIYRIKKCDPPLCEEKCNDEVPPMPMAMSKEEMQATIEELRNNLSEIESKI
jgi:hypothetical protein